MSTDERNAGRITLKVGGRPIAPALAEREHELAMIAAEAMWFPYFGDEGQTFEERHPNLTAHWKDYGRFAIAALRPYLTTTAPSTDATRPVEGRGVK